MWSTTQEKHSAGVRLLCNKVTNQFEFLPRIAAACRPVGKVMTIVDDNYIPQPALYASLSVWAKYRPVNTSDYAGIIKAGIGIASGPLPKDQVHSIELTSNVTDQTCWRQVENAKGRSSL